MSTVPVNRLDPITVEVIGSALSSIVEEMGEALVCASFSTNIKERRDCSTALYDRHEATLCQAEHIPIHLGSFIGIIPEILKRHRVETMRPGDVFIGNDAYAGGGTHLPDIVLGEPIFADGRIVPGRSILRTMPISPIAATPTFTRKGCGYRPSAFFPLANCSRTCRS